VVRTGYWWRWQFVIDLIWIKDFMFLKRFNCSGQADQAVAHQPSSRLLRPSCGIMTNIKGWLAESPQVPITGGFHAHR
jgi:hypothetical protein